MLLLFGRFKDPARLGLGVVMVVIGIVIHELLLALIGAVLVVWGLYAVAGRLRGRSHGQRDGGNGGNGGNGGDAGDGGEGGRRSQR
jgi:hypothetical protein